jgi:spore photoproduct lyase
VSRLEGGTSKLAARMEAIRHLALPRSHKGGGYPVGIVLTPVMSFPDWEMHNGSFIKFLSAYLDFSSDLSFECITHRFTPGSKYVLLQWYPNTKLDLDESKRMVKYNKFGGRKYVYSPEIMRELKGFISGQIKAHFPEAEVLYWT